MNKLCKKNLRRIEKGLDPVPHEDFESEFFATWLRASGLKFTHIANERMTSAKHGAKLKRLGVSAGVPDFMIVLPHDDPERENRLMFIEMKRAEKSFSAVSPEQHVWNQVLDNCRGVGAFICYGAEEAIEIIKQFLPEHILRRCPEIL